SRLYNRYVSSVIPNHSLIKRPFFIAHCFGKDITYFLMLAEMLLELSNIDAGQAKYWFQSVPLRLD
ncbi:MAG: hypothetical protein ACI4TU_07810, partial [Candidatus Cryptobacteroides sp.]